MIEAIARIGKMVLEKQGEVSVIDQLVENPGYPSCVLISLRVDGEGNAVWEGCEVEECGSDYKKYLFRSGSTRGINYSPTARITTIENTYDQKVLGWFRKVNRVMDDPFLRSIEHVLVQQQEAILHEMKDKLSLSGERAIVSLKINGAYLYGWTPFQDAFLYLVNEKDMELAARHQVCAICGERKETVIGKLSVFRFYTLDKPGFITGGFDEAKAWRNYPVCLSCKSHIEEGRKFIESYLQYRFYGFSYLAIPKLLIPAGRDVLDELLEYLVNGKKDIRIHQDQAESFMTTEEDLLGTLQDYDNSLSLQLLFLQRIQSAERILLLIEDVLPSRISELFRAKKATETLLYREGNHPFHFGFIRTFFPSGVYDKYFLQVVEYVFQKKPLSISFFAPFFMKQLRADFHGYETGEGLFVVKTRQAIAVMVFLEQAGVLMRKGDRVVEGKFARLFETYGGQLESPEKQAVFLLGALTQMLLDIQQQQRGSKPFLKQLMGLKMDQQAIKGLLPKVIGKLEEYESYYGGYRRLAEEISHLFLSSSPRWKLSVDELNFYFACGMNLVSKVREIVWNKGEQSYGEATF
ncbi:TIGR02556 family CRISPR-associated protein [Geobacillus stearothermophilus]|uniref:TIGR02556 family CRISPR-associated protein n=1 Tax=Geobacillus stearothermophilus TaxID=1422 RepID=UPI002E1C486D|nr:TIGR02556 family CRISPR-associated protein [Geobacillus stearothermophilus]MED3720437.1 TIGR02556 family CRISPR-associated protein [Geobacillus stearothermophilus]MED3721946.1 TIGR02556 family CRISPR-associated protein [Geobacillus stearothermophilus]MED3770448.1 TIGR02556 family CRISPR-associated protein [Geobacillus stearothermophilus]MED3772697.1 TIGR02556 family CRISPR-associated protein [Geobacillus stearothermophilus]MED4870846.1 TIGR02556 family CRISPR-associated protein [Geobacillus